MKQKIFDFLPVVLLSIITIIIHYIDIKPSQQGFFCGDHSLKYPYIENQTIPSYICFTIWVGISLFTILSTQIISFTTLIEKDLDIIWVDRIVNKLITSQIVKQIFDGIV